MHTRTCRQLLSSPICALAPGVPQQLKDQVGRQRVLHAGALQLVRVHAPQRLERCVCGTGRGVCSQAAALGLVFVCVGESDGLQRLGWVDVGRLVQDKSMVDRCGRR